MILSIPLQSQMIFLERHSANYRTNHDRLLPELGVPGAVDSLTIGGDLDILKHEDEFFKERLCSNNT